MSTTTYYAYDKSHRMTTQYALGGEAHYFTYDERDLVTQIQDFNGSGDTNRYFVYNGVGERTVMRDSSANLSYMTYDGPKLLTEKTETGTALGRYRHNMSIQDRVRGSGLEFSISNGTTTNVYNPAFDHTGNTRYSFASEAAFVSYVYDVNGRQLLAPGGVASGSNLTTSRLQGLTGYGLEQLTTTEPMALNFTVLFLQAQSVLACPRRDWIWPRIWFMVPPPPGPSKCDCTGLEIVFDGWKNDDPWVDWKEYDTPILKPDGTPAPYPPEGKPGELKLLPAPKSPSLGATKAITVHYTPKRDHCFLHQEVHKFHTFRDEATAKAVHDRSKAKGLNVKLDGKCMEEVRLDDLGPGNTNPAQYTGDYLRDLPSVQVYKGNPAGYETLKFVATVTIVDDSTPPVACPQKREWGFTASYAVGGEKPKVEQWQKDQT